MKSIIVLASAILTCAISAPAEAFHPFDETYGYVPPKKLQRAGHADDGSQQLFGMGWDWDRQKSQSDIASGGHQDDAGEPASLTGGGRPHIAAVAPPKVSFASDYGAGSIVIDTAGRRLYYVLSTSTAYSYPIAVGKQGFAWSGTEMISY